MINEQRKNDPLSAIVVSASSDIGAAMSMEWAGKNRKVFGTYRTRSEQVDKMSEKGIHLVHCDMKDAASIRSASADLISHCPKWDVLVLAPGLQDPIGRFLDCEFDEWEESIRVNFSGQLRIMHELMPFRNTGRELEPLVIFFAGGGTNNATLNYSAYTISKIALIKMVELLDAEVGDTRFTILGPGWVKTKIHESTLQAGSKAGSNLQKTREKLASEQCTPMQDVLDCCEWMVASPRKNISGRNFSVVFDKWGSPDLDRQLAGNADLYKLRRQGNEILKRS